MKIKKQLLISHLLIFIIPASIIVAIFYFKLVEILTVSTTEYTEVLVEQANTNIGNLINEAENAAAMLSNEVILQQALRERPELSSYDAYRIRMNRWMKSLCDYTTPQIDAFYVLGKYHLLSSCNTASDDIAKRHEEDWYKKALEKDGIIWFPSHEGSFVDDRDDRMISMATTIHDSLTDEVLGVLLIEIKEAEFRNRTDINIEGINVQLLDETGNPVYQPEGIDSNVFKPMIFGLSSDYSYTCNQTIDNGWVIQAEIPVSRLAMEKSYPMLSVLVMLVLVTIVVVLFTSIEISKMISSPIQELQEAFLVVESGDFDVNVSNGAASYELQSLNKSFNGMVEHLRNLLIRERQNQKKLNEIQLAVLTSQINPHFLYNTLDTIAWNIRSNNNQEALEALFALTQLFRISISKGHEVITLKSEFEHVQMYLTLQRMRYSDILEYEINIPEQLEHYYTLKLLLQPLVENSIYHGIKPKDQKGLIKVSASEKDEDIELVVTDNGAGMDSEQLCRMNKLLDDVTKVDEQTFGVLNVNLRIKMAYGNKYGIRFESEKGVYTKASVLIPKTEDKTDNVYDVKPVNLSYSAKTKN